MNTINITQQPGRTAFADGKEYLFFSGYAYLGMGHVPEFEALLKEGTDKYGLLFPSSRISNTRLPLYEACENLLSSITGTEQTVLTSSGYMAGRMAVEVWQHQVMNWPGAHPAIKYTGAITHGELKITAADAVNTLTATVTDFSLIEDNTDFFIVDDSHGFGLLGDKGEGIASRLPKDKGIDYILTYSLSKACNIIGGAVSCSAATATKLRAMPAYTASTAPAPAYLYAFINGQHLYQQQRKKLKENAAYFRSLIQHMPGIVSHPELPVFVLPSSVNEQQLMDKGIIISSFAYPDPDGNKIQRIVLSALHTKEDMERLAACL